MKLFSFFFILLAVASLALGLNNYRDEEAIFARAEQETATLKEYIPDPNPKVADFCPVYEYTTKGGRTVSYTGDNCVAEPDETTIGQTETVYFDPQHPYIVETRGWFGSEGSGLIGGILGFVFFGLMAGVPLLADWLRRRLVQRRAET